MEILEWIFHKASKRQRSQSNLKKVSFTARVEDEIISLKALLTFVLSGEFVPIQTGKGIGRVGLDKIVLPESISFSENKELNRAILLHKTLVAGIIYRDKMQYSSLGLSYAQRTLEICEARKHITKELNEIFPQFSHLHLLVDFQLDSLKSEEEKREFMKLNSTKEHEYFFRWKKFPEFEMAPWVELISRSESGVKSQDFIPQSGQGERDQRETEREGISSTEAPEEISLKEKEKEQSPVFHSFEKLETADEYNGGSRVNDAKDDLDAHFDALEELNLKHVTREEGGAGSIYRANFSELFGLGFGKMPVARYPDFTFVPEWNYKSQSLQKDHCRLYLLGPETLQANLERDLRAELNKKYCSEIQAWRGKFSSLLQHRAWKDRCLEGEEWNIDAYSKYMADMKACGTGDNRFFSQRTHAPSDFEVSILMDLSLSSDSWVQNKRVLDIQIESIGLCGLLLEELSSTISVYGAWSETRHHCYFSPIKERKCDWGKFFEVANQISPRGYTRLGPAIRRASSLLHESPTKKKLLILMTDGKPTDLDQYEGKYGMEDMRHALLEAEQLGIFVHALAVEQSAKSHFPQVFQNGKFQILSDPKKLPEQLFQIYFNFARQRH